MLKLIGAILVIWLLLIVVGFVVKGLIWLAIIGFILFAVTTVWGWMTKPSVRR